MCFLSGDARSRNSIHYWHRYLVLFVWKTHKGFTQVSDRLSGTRKIVERHLGKSPFEGEILMEMCSGLSWHVIWAIYYIRMFLAFIRLMDAPKSSFRAPSVRMQRARSWNSVTNDIKNLFCSFWRNTKRFTLASTRMHAKQIEYGKSFSRSSSLKVRSPAYKMLIIQRIPALELPEIKNALKRNYIVSLETAKFIIPICFEGPLASSHWLPTFSFTKRLNRGAKSPTATWHE